MQPVHEMGGGAGNDLAQVGLGLHAFERRRPDQRIEESGSLAPASLPANSQFLLPRATGLMAFSAALLLILSRRRRSSRAGIADGAGEITLARDALQLGIEPSRQFVEPRFRQALADIGRCSAGAPTIGRSMSNSAPIFSSASRAIVDPLPFSSSKKPRRPCA